MQHYTIFSTKTPHSRNADLQRVEAPATHNVHSSFNLCDAGQTVETANAPAPVINRDFTHIYSNISNEIIHFDQFILVSKVSQDVLHDALAKVFGNGRNIRRELVRCNS